MLVSAKEMLDKAREGKYAVGQFNINNLEWTKSVLLTAEELKSPVILGVSEGAGKYMTGFKTVSAMVQAMKAKDKARKESLSMLLSALKNAEIDKRSPLTEEEADAVVKKEIKQTKETQELAPADRVDIREEAQARLAVYQEFAPEDLTEEQIAEVIKSVLAELGIENPAPSDKGKIMKTLMPKVKGKADGKVVNQVLAGILSK